MGEHATRLKRQEEGLQTHLESIQGLQVEEGKLNVSVARLSMEKRALLLRAGFVDASDEGAVSGEIDVTKISEVVLEKRETVARLECRKDQLQKRCREMQVRKLDPHESRYVKGTTARGLHINRCSALCSELKAKVPSTSCTEKGRVAG